jgi:hypothetical protein
MDVFDELYAKASEEQLHALHSEIFTVNDNAITSEQFSMPLLNLENRYSFPKNSEALRIWNECQFYETEFESKILRHLYKWANRQKLLQYDDKQHNVYISWKSPSGVLYNTSWTTFTKWFLCACGPA